MTNNEFNEKMIDLEQQFYINEKKKNLDNLTEINDFIREKNKNNTIDLINNSYKSEKKIEPDVIGDDKYVTRNVPGITPFDLKK